MKIKFLGTHCAESKNTRLVSFLIDDIIAVDAGSLVSELTFPEQKQIRAILLSHGHYDHIRDVPAFAFNNADRTTEVIATKRTLEILSSHLIDGVIYPEFTSENSYLGKAVIQLVPVELYQKYKFEDYRILSLPVKHPLEGAGFFVTSPDNRNFFYTGDTGPGLELIWKQISPQWLIIDVTWSNNMVHATREVGHMCPKMLKKELIEFQHSKGYFPEVVAVHLNPDYETQITSEIKKVSESLGTEIIIAKEGEVLNI